MLSLHQQIKKRNARTDKTANKKKSIKSIKSYESNG
nr:MAG TPA: hypothetical protein [Caudoviricetes sp.]